MAKAWKLGDPWTQDMKDRAKKTREQRRLNLPVASAQVLRTLPQRGVKRQHNSVDTLAKLIVAVAKELHREVGG